MRMVFKRFGDAGAKLCWLTRDRDNTVDLSLRQTWLGKKVVSNQKIWRSDRLVGRTSGQKLVDIVTQPE